MTVFETLEKEHAGFMRKLRNDPLVSCWMLSPAVPISKMQQEQWFIDYLTDENHYVFVAIMVGPAIEKHLETRVPVGYIQLWVDPDHRSAEAAFAVKPDYWRLGYGAEMVDFAKSFAFENLSLHRLWLRTLWHNDRARDLFKSTGFTEDGVLRDACLKAGDYHNVVCMSILEEEYWANFS